MIPSIILISALSIISNIQSLQNLATNPWDEYDIYILAIQWGSTMCLTAKNESYCYELLKQIPIHSMSIHGLWPTFASGKYLSNCNTGDEITVNDTGSETFLKMRQYWPSLSNTNQYFWTHEYNKHGFCYIKKMELDERDYEIYFNKTLDLFFENTMENIIIEFYGHKDNGDYVLTDLKNKLDEKFGENTYSLRCKNYEEKYYLYEIRFRLDMNLSITTNGKTDTNCPNGTNIYARFVNFDTINNNICFINMKFIYLILILFLF